MAHIFLVCGSNGGKPTVCENPIVVNQKVINKTFNLNDRIQLIHLLCKLELGYGAFDSLNSIGFIPVINATLSAEQLQGEIDNDRYNFLRWDNTVTTGSEK